MNRIPNKFQLLKILQDQIISTTEIEEKNELQKKYDQIKSSMPKYRPHVLKKHGL